MKYRLRKPMLDRLYKAALEFANEVRQALDLDEVDALPRGVASEPTDCPLARAIGGCEVFPTGPIGDPKWALRFFAPGRGQQLLDAGLPKLETLDPPDWPAVPAEPAAFAKAFDQGQYPDLIDEEATARCADVG